MGRAWGIPGVLSLHHFVGYNRGFQLDAILAKMKSRISWTEILALGQELLGLSGTIKYSRWFWVNKIHLPCFSLSPWSLESPSKLTHEGIREQTVLTHKSTSCESETAREPWGSGPASAKGTTSLPSLTPSGSSIWVCCRECSTATHLGPMAARDYPLFPAKNPFCVHCFSLIPCFSLYPSSIVPSIPQWLTHSLDMPSFWAHLVWPAGVWSMSCWRAIQPNELLPK